MATYLLTWNPAKWEWKDYDDRLREVAERGSFTFPWDTGANRRVRAGDRVFLLRQGLEPRGIVGSGHAVSDVYQDEHWNPIREGLANYIVVEWDHLVDPTRDWYIPRKRLDAEIFSGVHWNTQRSGITIREDVAEILEEEWERAMRGR